MGTEKAEDEERELCPASRRLPCVKLTEKLHEEEILQQRASEVDTVTLARGKEELTLLPDSRLLQQGESHGIARCLTGVSGATATRVVELARLSVGERLSKGRPMKVYPAQRLWTTNGADRQGTARPATLTGDTDYLWIVGQCGDSLPPPQNVSVVCKTEMFAKTECPRAHKVSPQLAAWASNEM